MMEKEVLLRFPYDEDFKDYGHEDSVMGFVLKQHGISVLHIDNPLIHNGLDPNDVFLAKSLKAVEKYVTNTAFQSDELVEQIKLFRIFKRIDRWRLSKCVALTFSLMKNRMEHNLFSETPSLFIFDFYRLGYLCLFSNVRK